MRALSDLSHGTVEDKLRWAFNLYDRDGDGVISRSDMESLVTSIYDMMGRNTEPLVDPVAVQAHIDHIMSQVPATVYCICICTSFLLNCLERMQLDR